MTDVTDFVIVGSGVIGSSIAYHIASSGARVTLADAATPAAPPSASWASAGGLRSQGRDGPERAISLLASARWQTLAEELQADLECSFGGHLHVAESESEEPVIEARIAADRAAGILIERLDAAALRQVAPSLAPHLRLGAWTPADGQANPAFVAKAFAKAAERLGAHRLLNTPVRAHFNNGRFDGVRLPDGGVLQADRVILAAGAWSVAWLREIGCVLPLRWRGLQMLLSDAAPIRLAPTVTAVGRNLSLKRTPLGAFMIGGCWFAAPEGCEPAVSPIPKHVEQQWAGALAILPHLAQRTLQRSWAGAEAQTLDSMPLIGPADAGGLYLATGFSNHGFQIAPTVGALVADELLLGSVAMLEPFRPGRFGRADKAWSRFCSEPVAF